MNTSAANQTIFVTLVRSQEEIACARILIDSIRTFGGRLSRCPVWVFKTDSLGTSVNRLEDLDVRILPLSLPGALSHFFFADKVAACAQAEEMVSASVGSLVWIDPVCLVVRPPRLYDLGQAWDAAVRPVHIRNVGLLPESPPDAFWKKIYETVGIKDITTTVETFVDGQRIRVYFNSHAFAIRPAKGILRRWLGFFETLVCDKAYQEEACQDDLHKVFLNQAVWSALLAAELDEARILELPPDYNYPYNLHGSVPAARRAAAMNDLVSIAYENRTLDPGQVGDIEIHEPLRSWLSARSR